MERAEAGSGRSPLLPLYSSSRSLVGMQPGGGGGGASPGVARANGGKPPRRAEPGASATAAVDESDPSAPGQSVTPGRDERVDHVWIGFFRKRDADRGGIASWLRRANHLIGGDVNHVELIFRLDGGRRSLACSVLYEEGVRFKIRTPENRYVQPFWELRTLKLTDEQKMRLYRFCWAQDRKPFNARGMYCNFLPLCLPWCCGTRDAPDGDSDAWFCSQLVLAALQDAFADDGAYADASPSATHPQALHDLLVERGAFSGVIAYRGDPSELDIEI